MTNLSPTNLTPRATVQLNIPFGPGSGIGNQKKTLFIANKLSSGLASTDTLYGPDIAGNTIANHADVLTQAGVGSEANVNYNANVLVDNQYTTKYFIFPPESTGSQATLSVTFTGTATAYGQVNTIFGGVTLQTPVVPGMTATDIAEQVVLTVANNTEGPIEAASSSNVTQFLFKQKGERGNGVLVTCQVQGSFGVTSTGQSAAPLSGGTVNDDWTASLAVINMSEFDYIICPGGDVVNTALLEAQVAEQNLGVPGLPNRFIDGYIGTEAQAAAYNAELNSVWGAVVWEGPESDYTPGQLAAHLSGCLSARESQSIVLLNHDGVGVRPGTEAFWQFRNPSSGVKTSPLDIQNALISGLTPISTSNSGRSFVVKACTSYFMNPQTSTLDLRATDWCDVTIGNLCRTALIEEWDSNFAGGVAAQNPQPGDKAPNDQVVTPDILTAHFNKVLDRQIENGYIQDYNVQFISLTPTGTFNYTIEIEPVVLSHQVNIDLNETSQIL